MTVPVSVQIESLFHQWISSLRDYSRSHGEWKNHIKDDLWDIYTELLSFSEAEGITDNAYYLLITSRDFEQHLALSTRTQNVIIN